MYMYYILYMYIYMYMYYILHIIYIYICIYIYIYMNTMCEVSLANYLRAAADAFRPLGTHQRY